MTHPADDEVRATDETAQYNEQNSQGTPNGSMREPVTGADGVQDRDQPGPEDVQGYLKSGEGLARPAPPDSPRDRQSS